MAEQVSKVSGIVQIDGTPVERTVRAFGYEAQTHAIDGNEVKLSRTLGHATSDPATGEYTIDLLAGYADPIFVVAFDDYGTDFTPGMAVAVGDRIHPTTPNGHVWETTGAGTLPSEEPTWVVDTETAQLYGTASMIARPFWRPMVHGPVVPELTGVVEWTPASLFQNGEAGAWYDPSDLTTLFQDAAGTTPVTADGDPVGLMMDKSGNGQSVAQTASTRRPTYRTDGTKHWLEFDGDNDFLTGAPTAAFDGDFSALWTGQSNLVEHIGAVFATSGDANRIVGFIDNRDRTDRRLGAVQNGLWLNNPIDPELTPHVWAIEREGLQSRGNIDGQTAYPNPNPVSSLATNDRIVLGRQMPEVAGAYSSLSGRLYGMIVAPLMSAQDKYKARMYLAKASGAPET